VLVVDSGTCKLYEMYASYPQGNGSWHAGSGAVWNLNSDALRPATWTSADAAGLPILPGLVNYDEVAAGAINHALRFTVNATQNTFLWPARHQASSNGDPNLPPMGLRFRLKAGRTPEVVEVKQNNQNSTLGTSSPDRPKERSGVYQVTLWLDFFPLQKNCGAPVVYNTA
jgi:hypothetical protein